MLEQVELSKLRGTGRTTLMHKKVVELIRDTLSEANEPVNRVLIQYLTYNVRSHQLEDLKVRVKEGLSDLNINVEVKAVKVDKKDVREHFYNASFLDEHRLLQSLTPNMGSSKCLTIYAVDHDFLENVYLGLLTSLVKIERSIIEGVVTHEWVN